MKKLAFYHLMLRFRRRLPLFLIYFAGYVIISVFILNFAVAQFLIDVYRKEGGLPRTYDERQALITDLVVSNNFVLSVSSCCSSSGCSGSSHVSCR